MTKRTYGHALRLALCLALAAAPASAARVENQTSDPVEYEQTGSGLLGGDFPSGYLAPQSGETIVLSGTAPYTILFSADGKTATSCEFSDPDATINLYDNWTVGVSSGCD